MVESTSDGLRPASGVDDLTETAGGLDLRTGGLREAVGVHRQRLGELAAAEHLDRDALARGQAGAAQGVEIDGGAVLEARVRSARLTGCVCVRKGSNGIDIFLFGPRSLRIRMWIGFWPPSKRARSLAPARAP